MIKHQSNARPLRLALGANGIFSVLTGIACLVAPGDIAALLFAKPVSLFGMSAATLVFELGIGLLVFAALVLWTASQAYISRGRAKIITAMDIGWVLASLDLLIFLPGLWTTEGAWTVGIVAAAVAVFAVEQALGLAVLYQGQNEVEAKTDGHRLTLSATGFAEASPERVWQVMSHHEAYADVADNLSKVEVVSGSGPDTKRRCYDKQGRGWNETCTRWEEGRAFAFRVHTEAPDYPYPIAQLSGEWSLEPMTGGTQIAMVFKVTAKPGFINGLMFRLMAAPFSKTCDRLLVNWIAIMEGRAADTRSGLIAHSGGDAAQPI